MYICTCVYLLRARSYAYVYIYRLKEYFENSKHNILLFINKTISSVLFVSLFVFLLSCFTFFTHITETLTYRSISRKRKCFKNLLFLKKIFKKVREIKIRRTQCGKNILGDGIVIIL